MRVRRIERVAVLGLGAMGRPIAATLLRAGFGVNLFDVRPEAYGELPAQGARPGVSPAEAARDADALVVMVHNMAQARAALFGEAGALDALSEATLVLLMSTVAPADARSLAAECRARALPFLDAPVSGGPVAAAQGTLSIIVGGEPDVLAAARPVLAALGDPARTWHVGPNPGDGQAMKMINQLMAGVNIAAACEAMALAARAGLDTHQTYEIVSQSAGGSWMFRDRVPRMLGGEFVPPRSVLETFVKDLGIVVETAEELALPVFMASVARQVFMAGIAAGFAGQDDAGLVRVYEQFAGVAVGPRPSSPDAIPAGGTIAGD